MAPVAADPLHIVMSGLAEGVKLTLSEEAHGLPRLTVLRIERTGLTLTLLVEGVGDDGWVRPLLPRGEPGEIARRGTLEVRTLEWGAVAIELDGNKHASTVEAPNEPDRFQVRLGVCEVRQVGMVEHRAPTWSCAVIAGAPQTDGIHQAWPAGSTYAEERREVLRHGDYGYEVPSDSRNSPSDHVVLDLGAHCEGTIRLGTFSGAATSIPRPGFLTFTGDAVPGPDTELVRGIVRGVSLLFGAAPAIVGWIARDGDGRVCSWLLCSAYSAAPLEHAWPVAAFVDANRPDMIGADELSGAMRAYLSRRKDLALDRVAWLASHGRSGPIDRLGSALRAAIETMVEAGSPEVPRTIIEKSRASGLIDDLASRVRSWSAQEGIEGCDEERLISKVRQVNDTSGLARLPELFRANGMEFGRVERDAWDFSNKCAHAAEPSMIGGEEMLFRFRALQALFGRIIVGVTGVHDHYIDYSTPGFPSRPVSDCVGGTDGGESNIMRWRHEGGT